MKCRKFNAIRSILLLLISNKGQDRIFQDKFELTRCVARSGCCTKKWNWGEGRGYRVLSVNRGSFFCFITTNCQRSTTRSNFAIQSRLIPGIDIASGKPICTNEEELLFNFCSFLLSSCVAREKRVFLFWELLEVSLLTIPITITSNRQNCTYLRFWAAFILISCRE